MWLRKTLLKNLGNNRMKPLHSLNHHSGLAGAAQGEPMRLLLASCLFAQIEGFSVLDVYHWKGFGKVWGLRGLRVQGP